MNDLSDHPFSPENIAYELGGSDKSERAWLRWCGDAERLLGHSLDGADVDGKGEGYSIDEAFERFERGESASAYVAMVKDRPRYRGRQD
ncbi:hypothetical protein Brsp07_04525 [Brucella sp. NBRC 14130]|uniref:hypothetical protein n=1 Tax=Brucella sp. NBRC 14130 TaxID=3075483 RepID=UPI0030B20B12